jgi:hypothetical protein
LGIDLQENKVRKDVKFMKKNDKFKLTRKQGSRARVHEK